MGVMPSPLRGSAGNSEFVVYARSPHHRSEARGEAGPALDRLIDQAVAEAHASAEGSDGP